MLMAAVLVSCTDSNIFKPAEPEPEPEDYITVSVNAPELVFEAEGGSRKITFKTNAKWTVETSEGWCSPSRKSGEASSSSFNLEVSANENIDERSATVTITAGTASKTITVRQKKMTPLSIDRTDFSLTSEGGEISFNVTAIVEYECEIDEAAASWITPLDSKAVETSIFNFAVAPNDGYSGRTGRIFITNADLGIEHVITVTQDQKDALWSETTLFEVPQKGGDITVDINANIDYEIIIGEDWIQRTSGKAAETDKIGFRVLENKNDEKREGGITFTSKDGKLTETITVVQKGLKTPDGNIGGMPEHPWE